MPGLLQTGEYARHLHRHVMPKVADDFIARLVEFRLRRRRVLADHSSLTVDFTLHESALRIRVADLYGSTFVEDPDQLTRYREVLDTVSAAAWSSP